MLSLNNTLRALTAFLALHMSCFALSAESATLQERYVLLAIQGDLSDASALFSEPSFPDDAESLQLRDRFEARFGRSAGEEETLDPQPFLDSVAKAYRTYWHAALTGDDDTALANLQIRLEELLESEKANHEPGEDPFELLGDLLARHPVHVYEGASPPLRDLIVWKESRVHSYQVRLPDRSVTLRVHFMKDFLLKGWKEYASLGLVTTTGWVQDGELYCLADAYDTGSERFEVSYLKHEARHLVDLERFPDLESEELEYRAKLTELAFANRSLTDVLTDFASKAAQNTESPHAMANWRVIRDIHYGVYGTEMPDGFADWESLAVGKVNRAARSLLKLNSETLQIKSRLVF